MELEAVSSSEDPELPFGQGVPRTVSSSEDAGHSRFGGLSHVGNWLGGSRRVLLLDPQSESSSRSLFLDHSSNSDMSLHC